MGASGWHYRVPYDSNPRAVLNTLPEERARAAFGTATPTVEQFDAAYRDGMDPLDDFPRWSGRYTTLYDNGAPSQVVVWGVSGD